MTNPDDFARKVREMRSNPAKHYARYMNADGFMDATGFTFATREIVDAFLRQYEECRQHEWQPIETAPKDGRHIIVADFTAGSLGFGYCGDMNNLGYREVQPWMDVAHWFEDGFYASNYGGDQEEPFMRVTHWMPLLPPPTSMQDDEKG